MEKSKARSRELRSPEVPEPTKAQKQTRKRKSMNQTIFSGSRGSHKPGLSAQLSFCANSFILSFWHVELFLRGGQCIVPPTPKQKFLMGSRPIIPLGARVTDACLHVHTCPRLLELLQTSDPPQEFVRTSGPCANSDSEVLGSQTPFRGLGPHLSIDFSPKAIFGV